MRECFPWYQELGASVLGMKETEMKEIASLLKQVVVDKKDAGEIAAHVKEFKTDFKKTQYCFDNKLGAYEYVKLR